MTIKGEVLEVGAGTGELYKHIDHSNAKLTLTDFSPAMCTKLREAVPGATIECCNAASLPFPNGCFDMLIAHHVLHHLDDPDAALEEFFRVLRPGGVLSVSLGSRDGMREILDLNTKIGRTNMVAETTRIVAETAKQCISKYFQDVQEREYAVDMNIGEPEPILDYLSSLGDEKMTEMEEGKARALIEEKIAEDGVFDVKKSVFRFEARRPQA